MKTTPLDFILIGASVSLLAGLSVLIVWTAPTSGTFALLLDVVIFLVAYVALSMALLAIVRKASPYPCGTFSTASRQFVYWKFNAVIVDLAMKAASPLNTVFTQALLHSGFGARVGPQVAIAGVLRDHPLLDIAEGATIGQNAVITAHAITGAKIELKPVKIGRRAVVGIGSIVMPGVEIGDDGVLAPGAVALIDTKIGANELWGGVPARRLKDLGSRHSTASEPVGAPGDQVS